MKKDRIRTCTFRGESNVNSEVIFDKDVERRDATGNLLHLIQSFPPLLLQDPASVDYKYTFD